MARSPHKGAEPAWSRQDEVLYRTCVVWSKLRAGEGAEPVYPGWSAIAHHGDNEIAFAAGQAAFYAWLPGGDGSYVRQRNVYMGWGGSGMAVAGLLSLTQALGNRRAENRALKEAAPRWTWIDATYFTVTNYGFQFVSGRQKATLFWDWASIDSMKVVGQGSVQMNGRSSSGPVSWLIQFEWAELLFVLWASVRQPQHPQYQSPGFLPQGWAQRAARLGRQLPSAAAALTS